MKTRSITSFISSANRQASEPVYNFTIDYPDAVLSCKEKEHMELNVLSFDMNNTMYNINDSNNHFQIKVDNTHTTQFYITKGNYTVKSLIIELKRLLSNNIIPNGHVLHTFFGSYADSISIEIIYNEPQNTYTFKRKITLPLGITIPTAFSLYIKPINMGQLIGLENNTEYQITPEGMSTNLINLIDYNKVIIRTENISYYYSNIENLADVNGNTQLFSNIVFWKSKADILPHQVIKYNNEDGGNSFVYKIENKQLNSIIFKLTNERGEYITDAPNYMMVVQFNFYEKEDMNATLKSMVSILNEMYSTLLFLMNRLRLLL
jgi:hypothetical protein